MRRATFATATIMAATFLALGAEPSAAAEAPDYSLTVYSSAAPGQMSTNALAGYAEQALPGYALVRDHRRMELRAGSAELRFTDVAKRIDPTTVSFTSITDPEGTRVVEQNYQFDLVSQQKLIERFIGTKISVDQVRGERVESVTGKLLSADGGLILEKDSGEIVTLASHSGDVRFPSLPGGLITRPTLVWLLDAGKGGAHDTRVSYQTSGMTWWSDYNVTLREEGERCDMDLAAWVTIVNRAGASFPQSRLKLVAGEVNRAPAAPMGIQVRRKAEMHDLAAASDGFQESTLFEYHLYTLGRRTDLPDNSTKQMELFPAATSVACRKQLVFSAAPPYMPHYYGTPISDQHFAATVTGTTGAYLEFDNKEANGMGMPLPAGRMRVNQAAVDGSLEFIGEDVIKHTPRNETLRVKLGNAFDIAGERKQTSFQYNDAGNYIDESFEVSVRNRKKTPVRVVAREYLYRWSGWKITSNDREFEKRDAQTIDFPLEIPADGEAKFTYTVRYSW